MPHTPPPPQGPDPAAPGPVRVLLADDQLLVRGGIAMLLNSEDDIDVVAEVADGAAAVATARELKPDVVVMDVRMPHIDGVEATRRITADHFSTDPDGPIKVLILTTYHLDEAVYAALRAGASGFMLKDAAPAELVRAVHTLARGDAWLNPVVTPNRLREFAARPEGRLPAPQRLAELTDRERQVFVLIAHGFTNPEIADHLTIGDATVKTHVSRLLMKLGARDRAQLVAVAYQSGLVAPGSVPPARETPTG
ncbi:response regulator transcription factor [Streptomyces sp. NPDC047043]|uniref:response regulator transcription factor n=1 Tax=Streptomyces sp. NPDC047043 TaxID=3154497 RepID=UPI0033E6E2B2